MTQIVSAGSGRIAGERHGTWYSFDTPYQRLALFSGWSVAGFGLAVGLGLVLVYPHQTLEQRLASRDLQRAPDRLTVEYLKVFLKAEPGAIALRHALVDQLVRLGSYGEARDALAPLLRADDAAVRLDAQWLELSMLEQEAFAAAEGSPDRAARYERMRAQLALLLQLPQDSQHLLILGRKALAAGAGRIAAQAFQKIAARPEVLAPEIYAEAASATLGLGNYAAAAELYFRAMQVTRVLDKRRVYYLTALRTLQSAGQNDGLIKAADAHLGALAGDTETLLFLARMAQSANELDAAQRYARLLLKLSLLERWQPQPVFQGPAAFYAQLARLDATPVRLQRVAGVGQPGGPPALKFNEEAYSLSYGIFLAARNLDDARRVAESAVQQQPDNPVWRKRLAEVNEWNGAPAAALPQWLAYARLSGDEAGWNNVMRLSGALSDTDVQTLVIEHKAALDPNNLDILKQLVQIYEGSGAPERALTLLRNRVASARGAHRRAELELLAALTERSGHDDETLATLRQLQTEFGPDSGWALRIANQLYRSGQNAVAFNELERAAATAVASDSAFWRAYAELARLLQDDVAAERGYRTLLVAELQTDNDLLNLIALLEERQPLAAARLAQYALVRGGNVRFAQLALTLRVRLADWAGAKAVLQLLTPAQRGLLEKDPDFLALRASLRQSDNDLHGATADLRAALALRPTDMELRANLIWLLIAARDTEPLKRALAAWAAEAERNPVLWDPYAAASMSINRQDQALHWFRKSGFQRTDALWLMSYAEALDANSQKDQAWQIRRRVWRDLRDPALLKQVKPEQLGAMRDRLVALSALFMNGDGAARVMRALLRADVSKLVAFVAPAGTPRNGQEMLAQLDQAGDTTPAVTLQADMQRAAQASPAPLEALLAPGSGTRPHDDARLTASARELALAYALNNSAGELASAWFATRFAGQLATPLWGELALVLAADDRARLDQLLDDLPDWLPMYDRIEAAQRAGRRGLAQTLAFDQLARLPQDEDLHLRLTNLTTEQPARFSIDQTQSTQSPLDTRERHLHAGVDLTPVLQLALDLTRSTYSSSDNNVLTNLPGADRKIALTLQRVVEGGFLSVTVQQRQAMSDHSGLRFDYNLALSSAVTVSGNLGMHQQADEASLLRVGARRDGAEANVNVALSQTDYARVGLGWHRYASQAGTVLGTGANWNAELGRHFRIDYPNLTLRLFASGSNWRDRGQVDPQIASLLPAETDLTTFRVLPENDHLLGLSLGLGTVIENRYSRAWRPFAEAGLTWSETVGRGYNLRAGIAGSVLGQDLMTLRAMRSSGTAAVPQGGQEIGIDYRWYF
jgi:hypothetical protein